MDRYGVDHPMQNIKIFHKAISSAFTRKPFIFPSGRVDYVLGYEPRALKELLDYYPEKDIITDIWTIPTFDYKRVSTSLRPLNKKSVISRYFPDILLPDKIVEVKSTYLYYKDRVNVIQKSYILINGIIQVEKWLEED